MVLVECRKLTPGMITARDVFNFNGLLLLHEGDTLDDSIISRLIFHGIRSIYVKEGNTGEVRIPETCSYGERIRASSEFVEFKKNYEMEVHFFRDSVNGLLKKNMPLEAEKLTEQVLELIRSTHGKIPIFDMMHSMRQYDDATFNHCMNVAIISNMLAGWLRWPEEKVRLATVCGLLHDIGKLMVPQELIQKPGRLSDKEFELVKKHSQEGYRFLREKGACREIQMAALMHHEKCDGSGYPMRLGREQIDSFARLVTIADIYDAMTSARIYRGPLCPFKVVRMFEEEGFRKYDTEYILTFLNHVTNTYIRNRVRLSDDREGEIVMIQKESLSRPLVRCENEIVDMLRYPELEITCII